LPAELVGFFFSRWQLYIGDSDDLTKIGPIGVCPKMCGPDATCPNDCYSRFRHNEL
jgi:hypothetical protein